MRHWMTMAALGGWLAAAAGTAALGQDTPLHRRVSVDYRGVELADVLKELGQKAGVSIQSSPIRGMPGW